MFDPPHLLKSTRNNFFNYRFISGDNIIESKHLKQFYNSDVQRTHCLDPKLTDKHINSDPFQKMKVKFAFQIFSKTVASEMNTCVMDGSLSFEAKDTIEFINSMVNLFVIFNSQIKVKLEEPYIDSNNEPHEDKRFCLPFKNAEYQTNYLLLMFDFFNNLKVQKYNVTKKSMDRCKK